MTAAAFPGDLPVTPALVKSHKLTPDEYQKLVEGLGRTPTYTELGVASVMWSEHCSYKSSRVHLRRLPTTGPRVIQGPGENAGVVDIGDGFAAIFKMESHNHPSYIEPYQGAATGVGGILRDVFTMGARPIASLNSLRFGAPSHPKTPSLLRGVVAGIAGYGNCVGVPTVGGELFFDRAYDGNILVNAFVCGVARTDRIFYGRATGVGNPVLYVGAKTGRDGIHGATMASDEFSAEGPSQRPTVQVGDPFYGKLLIEACLEIFAANLLEGIQDMGAAGLTSSSVEMAARGEAGLLLDLDAVPRRTSGMTPYELLLSESQERMLLVCRPGCEAKVLAICAKWELDAAVIGEVTDTGRWVVTATPGYDPAVSADKPAGAERVVVADLPVPLLGDAAPCYERPRRTPAAWPTLDPARLPSGLAATRGPEAAPPRGASSAQCASWGELLLTLLARPNLGSRQWVYRQYDHIVRGGTAIRPGGGAAVVRVPCERDGTTLEKYLAFSADCSARRVALEPFQGGALAVAEACRNLACVGARPIGLTDCLNFGSPENPEVMEQFAQAIDGMAAACRALEVPIVSGNVSFYNETDGRPILPTPTIGAVGQLRDERALVTHTLKEGGQLLLLLGRATGDGLGGSELADLATGELAAGPSPGFRLDLALEAKLQLLLVELAEAGLLQSAQDIAEGGLAVTLAECCTQNHGATVTLPPAPSGARASATAEDLFGEAPSRVVVSVRQAALPEVEERARRAGVPLDRVGEVNVTGRLVLRQGAETLLDVPFAALSAARESCLDALVGA